MLVVAVCPILFFSLSYLDGALANFGDLKERVNQMAFGLSLQQWEHLEKYRIAQVCALTYFVPLSNVGVRSFEVCRGAVAQWRNVKFVVGSTGHNKNFHLSGCQHAETMVII